MAAVSMMAYSARESFHAYPQQQLGAYQTAPQEPRSYPSHAPNSNSPYPTHHTQMQQQPQPQPPPQQQQHFGHHRSSSASSSSWPVERPAGDSSKPSLPGIASLLNVADGDRARTSHANSPPLSRHFHDRVQVLPDRPAYSLHALDRKPSPPSRPPWLESAASPRQTPDLAHTAVPTPLPFRHSSAGDRARSPSTHSTGSAASIPPRHSAGAVGSIEPGAPRPEPMHGVQSSPIPAQLAASPRSKPAVSPYLATVNNPPRYPVAYPSPETPTPAASDDLYQQRPLPPNFPPHAVAPAAVQAENGPTSNPWQHHHHYISNSAHATFPPSQDRYICPTCQKAFSRPSSLKIHCHSHTGEKPFRCPHAGCGKAFSVRSNMKRHERGCHSGIGFAPGDDVSMIDQ